MTGPYPGLRPFQAEDEAVFFGREAHVDDLIGRLRRQRFIAVVGTSGSGKSSLVRAGLLPALYGGHMAGNAAQWRIAVMRPGSDPIGNLASALDGAGILEGIGPAGDLRAGLTRAILERGALGLVEVCRQSRAVAGDNVLIVVDQFEEVFRYAAAVGNAAGDRAAAFVKLLLGAAGYADAALYVVITMRSDFLGDCSRFRDLPEAINDGLFLVPRMTRDQLHAAISAPARVAGTHLTARLITRLLNDLGDDPDELPVLAHALMRTWTSRQEHGTPDVSLDLADYTATGGMAAALSRHGDDVYAALPDEETRALAGRIFKALTERGRDNRGIRRPVRFDELCAIVAAGADEVRAVVDAFRTPTCSFLTPPAGVPLEPNTIVDIAHESLMRKWQRLAAWVDEEALSAQTYRRLAGAAALHESGEAALWRDPDLALALAWRGAAQPNAAWGERYAPGFERAIGFLDASAAEREREGRARTMRTRVTVGSLAAFALVLCVLLAFARYQYVEATAALVRSEAGQVAGTALGLPPENLDEALVLAAEANARADTPQTRDALYQIADRSPRLRRTFHRAAAPAFSMDGRYLAMTTHRTSPAAGSDEESVWDTATSTVARRWNVARAKGDGPTAQCFSGRYLIRADAGGVVRAFDWQAMRAAMSPVRMSGGGFIRGIACFTHGARIAVATSSGNVRAIDLTNGRTLWQHDAGDGSLWSIASAPGGAFLAVGGDDGRVRILGADGSLRGRCDTGTGAPLSILSVLGDGTIVAATGGERVIARISAGCERVAHVPAAGSLRSLAVTPAGTLIESLTDGSIVAANADGDANTVEPFEPWSGTSAAIDLDPRARWLAAATATGVKLYSAAPRFHVRPLRFIARAPRNYQAFAFEPGGANLLALTGDREIDRWNAEDAKAGAGLSQDATMQPHVFALAPDGTTLYLASNGQLQRFHVSAANIALQSPIPALRAGADPVQMTVSSDGSRLVTRSAGGHIDVRSAATGMLESGFVLPEQQGAADADETQLSPHGTYVAQTERTGAFDLYATNGTRVIHQRDDGAAHLAGFSDDDAYVFVGNNAHLDIWQTADGRRQPGSVSLDNADNADSNALVVAAASPAARWIAVSAPLAGGSYGVQLYDFQTRLKIGLPLRGVDDAIRELHFSSDGAWLAARTLGGTIFVWETGPPAWRQRACEAANLVPSAGVWSGYAVPFPYAGVCNAYGVPQGEGQP